MNKKGPFLKAVTTEGVWNVFYWIYFGVTDLQLVYKANNTIDSDISFVVEQTFKNRSNNS